MRFATGGGLLARRGDHHHHLAAFELGELLHLDGVRQIVTQTVQQVQTDLLVRDFTAAETQRDLALVTIGQESADVAQLDVVVAVVYLGGISLP